MSLKTSPLTISRTAGCTLTGALAVTTSVTDSITIIHGPDGCSHHNFSLLHATYLDNGNLRIPRVLSSGLNGTDIIFGGESALIRAINRALEEQPGIIFVLSTCITDTIGDDVPGICRNSGTNLCYVPTSGFLGGTFEDGFSNALISVANTLASENMKPIAHDNPEFRVNLIGEKNLEYEVEQNYNEVCRLLSLLGITVHTRFIHELTSSDLFTLPDADLNILRDPSLSTVGRTLQGLFGTPYIDSFPVGLSGTLQFLHDIGTIAGIPYGPAIELEEEHQQSMLKQFSDLAGTSVNCTHQSHVPETDIIDEIMHSIGLHEEKEGVGVPVPLPLPLPIGTGGIRRMLHCWRRTIT